MYIYILILRDPKCQAINHPKWSHIVGAPPISLNIIGLTMKSFPMKEKYIHPNSGSFLWQLLPIGMAWMAWRIMEAAVRGGPILLTFAALLAEVHERGQHLPVGAAVWRIRTANESSRCREMAWERRGEKDDAKKNVRFWSNLWWMPKISPPLGGFSHVTFGAPHWVTGCHRMSLRPPEVT